MHLAAGDGEVIHTADEAPHPEAGGEAADDITHNDDPVDRVQRHEKGERPGGGAGEATGVRWRNAARREADFLLPANHVKSPERNPPDRDFLQEGTKETEGSNPGYPNSVLSVFSCKTL